MAITFANESVEYRAARDALLDQEIGLRRQMEAVAEARRALPPGPVVENEYVFEGLGEDGKPTRIRLSEMFRAGTDSLMIYHYMFPRYPSDDRAGAASGETARLPKAEQPCPSCTGLLDQLDAAAQHFEAGGGNFAVVAKVPLDRMLGVARDRGWRHLRMISSVGNDFKCDYHGEYDDGHPAPIVTVFKREADGTIRLFWASEMVYAPKDPGQDPRAAGTIEPFWNMFDLTPGGRPDFQEQLQYDCCAGVVPAALEDGHVQARDGAGDCAR